MVVDMFSPPLMNLSSTNLSKTNGGRSPSHHWSGPAAEQFIMAELYARPAAQPQVVGRHRIRRLDPEQGERYSSAMRVAKGKVVAGKVVVEGAPLEEGATVTVLAPEDAETFELGPAEEAELLAAIADAERGDLVEGSDVIAKLSSRD
jgi:hypothetical protein